MTEFVVGQRVKYVGKFYSFMTDGEGVIVSIDMKRFFPIEVKFDDANEHGCMCAEQELEAA